MRTDSYGFAQTVFTAIAAVSTSLAVVSALWLQWIRDYLRRPKLALFFDAGRMAGNCYSVTSNAKSKVLWVRCMVSNTGRAFTAANVQVFMELCKLESGVFLPSRTLPWADLSTGTIDIQSGVTRFVDLASATVPDGATTSRLRIMLFPWKSDDPEDDINDSRHFLLAGHYSLRLSVSARDVPARFYDVTIDFDGRYSPEPDDLADGVRILIRSASKTGMTAKVNHAQLRARMMWSGRC